MPSSYVSLNVHIVFSTKYRAPYLQASIAGRVHDYVGGTIRGLGATPIRVGGIEDHMHVLLSMRGHQSVSKLVQELKKSTTPWLKDQIPSFGWQEGYGAFSVSYREIPEVVHYIDNQREHHQRLSFIEERKMLFELAGIDYVEDED